VGRDLKEQVMGVFDGKVAIVTGAGRGIGRCEALLLAWEGAKVVVNDLGGSGAGEGADQTPAQQVVDEITAAGGEAVANYDDCSSWTGAEAMVQQAVDTFGGLDVLICNAGILRDKMSFNMTEEEFDAVIRVHLKGHFAPIRFAAAHWRAKAKETGEPANGAIVTTSSEAGLYGNAGQANYAAAKGGIASMTITLARELERIGVRVNAIAPLAATRLLGTVGMGEDLANDPKLAPENPATGAVWLASPLAEGISGQVMKFGGGVAQLIKGWRPIAEVANEAIWSLDDLTEARPTLFEGRDPGVPPFFPPVES
jgi:NAD(P)-dependent dehydrogenase (short-subunit alcohol dehydrogenase family)